MISSSIPAFPVILLHPGTKSCKYFILSLIFSLLAYTKPLITWLVKKIILQNDQETNKSKKEKATHKKKLGVLLAYSFS